ncbi:MAG: xanthine dehydrogenase family protein subunit M [Caldilineaceae bacterium]|nr:xanthine dehydrogenase family protein subunit M [Caldilineaceae bacterium]
MKPAPFSYFAPSDLAAALELLSHHGYDAKVLAGGQSLIPTMNFRLAQPQVLIDLNGIQELFYVKEERDGQLRIGAMTRQRTLECSDVIARHVPLLHGVMPFIAHVQIRNRGTIGGSLAHADPAAELPAVMVALNARFRLQSTHGERWVNAADFYIGLFTTELAPDEILTEIAVPSLPARSGWSMQEIARRHGDYALVGVAATVTLDGADRCQDVRLVYLSVGEGPTQALTATRTLIGEQATPDVIAAAAHAAAHDDIEPLGDIHATAAYRRHLVEVLGRRALQEAVARAKS